MTFHGIIVFYKNYNERTALIGVLTNESMYIKGYVQIDPRLQMPYALGQQVVAGFDHAVPGITRFIIDSAENYVPSLFWHDRAKLVSAMQIMNLITRLPEQMHFEGLYEKFLQTLAKLLVEQTDCSVIANEWEQYIISLL